MIETIKTYSGTPRWEGRVKVTMGLAYRCTKCDKITLKKKELEKHECIPKDQ